MGTFSRIRYVIAANMNALLEKAENPEKLLRALIREMEDAGEEARLAVADLLAEQQHLERRDTRLSGEIAEWQGRAEQAVAAERDDLARAALQARAEREAEQGSVRAERAALAGRVTQLETDMTTLKAKLAEAKLRLREMNVRERVRTVPVRRDDRLSRNERRVRQAMGRFDRLEGQVERLEARVRSYEMGETAPSPWAGVEAESDPAIEAELDALKKRLSGAGEGTENPAQPATADDPS